MFRNRLAFAAPSPEGWTPIPATASIFPPVFLSDAAPGFPLGPVYSGATATLPLPTATESDQSLLERVALGDEAPLERLYDKYSAALYAALDFIRARGRRAKLVTQAAAAEPDLTPAMGAPQPGTDRDLERMERRKVVVDGHGLEQSIPVPLSGDIAGFALTEEPAGGSSQPTSTPFLAGMRHPTR